MESTYQPQTLLEAVRAFADKQVAHDFFVRMRFPYGVACPRLGCGSADVAAIKNRNAWRCRDCNRQFTAKVGTIFEDSPIGFDKWLPAMWLITANRNGVSSYEIARGIGVTQKTAWFMLHRLRLAMKVDNLDEKKIREAIGKLEFELTRYDELRANTTEMIKAYRKRLSLLGADIHMLGRHPYASASRRGATCETAQ